MEAKEKFKIGSSIFFFEYPDYKVKDIDWVAIMDSFPFQRLMVKVKIGDDDIFMYKPDVNKQDFIDEVLESKVFMKVGKFLCPEFCKHIGFTINDLKLFEEIFNNLDDKHKYEKIIYDAYIENNDFYLTDKQRLNAYNEYKKCR